ncbi:hypothetical protein [Bacillus phage vB_BceM_Bc431v3]|uniref:Uncharacterized protein n=1 Tax=Bacillus phage vB_BceM_Bc431v3 TaxID=1195072 RepID=M4HNP4_9CAUD|nr:hypothetical protein K201_gp143 [Bacillus phage vB_BceM_Bc431v3]AFQ96451.1 hypothetical protein [Bacillus phage vB_BceM_Bc431v3]
MAKEKMFTFIYKKKGDVVGAKSWFYESETEATLKAQDYMSMYEGDVVEIHHYDENAGIFTLYVSVTNKRNDIKWKEVYNAQNMFGKAFHYCQEVAENVGYKYLLFNGVVYSVNGTLNQGLCEEKDLIV